MDKERFFRDFLGIQDPVMVKKIASLAQIRVLQAGELLFHEGEPVTEVTFLLYGLMRGFYTDAHGREVTDCFSVEFGTATMPTSQLSEKSSISMQALEYCELLSLPMEETLQILSQSTDCLRVYNNLLRESMMTHWELKSVVGQRTARERYLWFLQRYPTLIERVNHKYIASFLGMTAVTLSRIRSEFREETSPDASNEK